MGGRAGAEHDLVETISGVMAFAIERGDLRSYRAFRDDGRWREHLAAEAREREEGQGAALVRDHEFNVYLYENGLLSLPGMPTMPVRHHLTGRPAGRAKRGHGIDLHTLARSPAAS